MFIDYARFHDATPDGASAYSADTSDGEDIINKAVSSSSATRGVLNAERDRAVRRGEVLEPGNLP